MFRWGGFLLSLLVLPTLAPVPQLPPPLPAASPPPLAIPQVLPGDPVAASPSPGGGSLSPGQPAAVPAPSPAGQPSRAGRSGGGYAASEPAPAAVPAAAAGRQGSPLVEFIVDSPLGPAPPVLGLLLLLVSAALALGRRLRERHRAAALEAAKQEFLKVASHELRTPLTVLRGYLSMAKDGTLGRLPERLEGALPVMQGKVTELERLVEQMLEAARIDEGQLRLDRRQLDLRDLGRARLGDLQGRITPRHALLYVTGPEPVIVYADERRLAAVLDSLVDNAVKYSPGGGQVSCAVKRDRGWAVFSVSDEGLGIAPDDRAHLFTRFGRIVTADNSSVMGTGLGLYLARELARRHGGDISVESELGAGSTFTLRLPLAVPLWERLPRPGSDRDGRNREPVS